MSEENKPMTVEEILLSKSYRAYQVYNKFNDQEVVPLKDVKEYLASTAQLRQEHDEANNILKEFISHTGKENPHKPGNWWIKRAPSDEMLNKATAHLNIQGQNG